ncbi:MAG: hypothetical protein MHM6MM_003172 [Cercozoa sp. M6MM]
MAEESAVREDFLKIGFDIGNEVREFRKQLEAWTATQKSEAELANRAHKTKMQNLRNEIDAAQAQIESLRLKIAEQHKEASDTEKKVQELQQQCDQLSLQVDKTLPDAVAKIDRQLRKRREAVQRKNETLESFAHEADAQATSVQERLALYEQFLGFSIGTGPNATLRLTFRYVDPQQPERQVHCDLRVLDGVYQCPQRELEGHVCEVLPLALLQKLLRRLNETQDLARFVHTLRHKLCLRLTRLQRRSGLSVPPHTDGTSPRVDSESANDGDHCLRQAEELALPAAAPEPVSKKRRLTRLLR